MGKALKIFLILNLLLSLVVVGFGVKIFMDREVIKARTIILQNNARQVAGNLQWGRQVDWDPDDPMRAEFTVPQPVDQEELPGLVSRLEELARLANHRVVLLDQHYADLIQTRNVLAETREELAVTQRNLARTEQELADTRETLRVTQNDLQEARRNIDRLESEKRGLQNQIASLNDELTRRNDRIQSLEVDLETRNQELARATERIARLEGRLARDGESDQGRWSGVPGEILAVNDQWKYVILNMGEVDEMELFLEAIVHRGDEYLGKITVVRVENTVSIAEIELATVPEGKSIQAGDTVFFN